MMRKILLLLTLFFLTACSQAAPTQNKETDSVSTETTASTSALPSKTAVPTLFIHGYSGGKASFGPLIERMEQAEIAKKELTLTIAGDGTIQTAGALSGDANNPMIQVLFQDNQSHEWNQAEWLRAALAYLKATYDIAAVKLVGHSMGGVSSLRYLGTYAEDDDLPIVEKFSAIGAPFNDFTDTIAEQTLDDLLAEGPTQLSARYEDYQAMLPVIPKMPVQLIAGQLSATDFSDDTVPLTSALAVYHLLKSQDFPISYAIITDNAQHSQLHENAEVDLLLQQFLWE